MHSARSQPRCQREAAVALVDVQREVLVLPEIAVVAAEGLVAVGRVIGGINVEDDFSRRRVRVRMNNLTRYSLRILRCFSWAARTSRRTGRSSRGSRPCVGYRRTGSVPRWNQRPAVGRGQG